MNEPEIRFTDKDGKQYPEWEKKKLGEVTDYAVTDCGINPKQTYLEIGDVASGTNQYHLDANKPIVSGAKYAKKDTILVSTVRPTRGAICKLNDDTFVSSAFAQLKAKNENSDVNFILQTCLKPSFLNYLGSVSEGGTYPTVNKDYIYSRLIDIPSLSEQHDIGSFFSFVDEKIKTEEAKTESLTKAKSALLDGMFPKDGESIPRIRFDGFTDPWEQRKLGDMGTTFTGLSGKSKEDFGHGDATFVTYMNVYSNPVADLSMTEHVEIDGHQNQVRYGDVFFTTSSETPDEVGMSSVWLGNTDNTYLNSFCFGYRPSNEIDPYYMAYMLRSDSIRKKLIFLAQGISRYNISKNRVMDIEIPLPELAEQKKIGAYFKALDNLITLHQRECQKWKDIKTALLQHMF